MNSKAKGKKNAVAVVSVLLMVVVFAGIFVLGIKGTPEAPVSATQPVHTTEETVNNTETQNAAEKEPDYKYLISCMTLEEKVAQMMLASCHENVDIEDAARFGVGGLCLFTHSFTDKSRDEVISMIKGYQSFSEIPLFVSADEEGGTVCRVSRNPDLRATPFLSPSDLYAQGGFELIKSDTEEKAELLLSLGVNVNLAPVCDVPENEDDFIYDRSFGTDADETAQYIELVVSTMKTSGVGSVLKHFPGYGGNIDTHYDVSYDRRDYSVFEQRDFKPFIAGIENGADCVMVNHNIVTCMDDSMPASLSKPVHDILRNELGFKGVIMTDDLTMQGITEFTDGRSAAVAAVMAGNDIIGCDDYRANTDAIVKAVQSGEISESQIDASVERILRFKHNLGII